MLGAPSVACFVRVDPRGRERPQVAAVCFLPPEAQKKQPEDSAELIREGHATGNADRSTAEPAPGGPDADGEETTDGPEEDSDEEAGHEPVGAKPAAPAPSGDSASAARSF